MCAGGNGSFESLLFSGNQNTLRIGPDRLRIPLLVAPTPPENPPHVQSFTLLTFRLAGQPSAVASVPAPPFETGSGFSSNVPRRVRIFARRPSANAVKSSTPVGRPSRSFTAR